MMESLMKQFHDAEIGPIASFEQIAELPLEDFADPSPLHYHTVVRDKPGFWYASDEYNHRIVVFSPEGLFSRVIGERGGEPGRFWYPRGICITANQGKEELLVCDSWNHRIQRFSLGGELLGHFGAIGEGDNDFNEPVVVLPAGDGELWILDRGNHRIKRVTLTGKILACIGEQMTIIQEEAANNPLTAFGAAFGPTTPTRRGLSYPLSMTLGHNGELIVADSNNRRLHIFDRQGETKQIIPLDSGVAPPYFFPATVVWSGAGNILVSDITGTSLLIDSARPWCRTELTPFRQSLAPVVMTPLESSPGTILFALFDPEQKKLRTLKLSLPPEGLPVSETILALCETADSVAPWNPLTAESLYKYLKAETTGENCDADRLEGALTYYQTHMVALQQSLNGAESDYIEAVSNYIDLITAGRINGTTPDPAMRTKAHLKQQLLMKRRRALRKDLVSVTLYASYLSAICTTRVKSAKLTEASLATVSFLTAEYGHRVNDLNTVADSFRRVLSDYKGIDARWGIHFICAMRILADHEEFLRVAIRFFDKDSPFSFLPNANLGLAGFRNMTDVVGQAESLTFHVGRVAHNWRLHKEALDLLLRELTRLDIDKVLQDVHAMPLLTGIIRRHAVDEETGKLLKSLFDRSPTPSVAMPLAETLLDQKEYDECARLISRFRDGGGDANEWDRVEARRRHAAKWPGITLHRGETVAEASSEIADKNGLATLRYEKSLPIPPLPFSELPQPYLLAGIDEGRSFVISNLLKSGISLLDAETGESTHFSIEGALPVGMTPLSKDELLLICAPSPATNITKRIFTILNIRTGEIKRKQNIKCALPSCPEKIIAIGVDEYLVTDHINGEVWRLSHDFTRSHRIDIPNRHYVFSAYHAGKVALVSARENAIDILDLATESVAPLECSGLINPHGVTFDHEGNLYVATTVSLGIQIFGNNGALVGRIPALIDGDRIYKLTTPAGLFTSVSKSSSPLLAVTDSINGAVHIFSFA